MRGLVAPDSPLSVLRRVLVAALAVGTILIGLFVGHSIVGAEAGPPTDSSVVTTHAQFNTSVARSAFSAATTPADLTIAGIPILGCDIICTTGCVMLSMACLVLLVLSIFILFARSPDSVRRTASTVRRRIQQIPESKNHLYLPSLSALSISRI